MSDPPTHAQPPEAVSRADQRQVLLHAAMPAAWARCSRCSCGSCWNLKSHHALSISTHPMRAHPSPGGQGGGQGRRQRREASPLSAAQNPPKPPQAPGVAARAPSPPPLPPTHSAHSECQPWYQET